MNILTKKSAFLAFFLSTIKSKEAIKDSNKTSFGDIEITTRIQNPNQKKHSIKKTSNQSKHKLNPSYLKSNEIITNIEKESPKQPQKETTNTNNYIIKNDDVIIKKTKKNSRKKKKIKQKRNIKTYFSPPIEGQKTTCTNKIIKEINNAKKSIFIQAYSFTSQPIIKALIKAHKKGIIIKVILDKTYAEKPCSYQLREHGIKVYTDLLKRGNKYNNGIAHNKVMIIDKKTVITGSFNFTNAAEHNNTENIIILRSKTLAKNYIINYNFRQENSVLIGSKEYKNKKKSRKKFRKKSRKQFLLK